PVSKQPLSSLRTQAPITTAVNWLEGNADRHFTDGPRSMGPCVRRDDGGDYSAGTMLGARIASRCSGRWRLALVRNSSVTPRGRRRRVVELGALTHDGLHGIDVMHDQLSRHFREIRRVLDDAAEAVGGGARGREAECDGVALDVMRGAKQFSAGDIGETVHADR